MGIHIFNMPYQRGDPHIQHTLPVWGSTYPIFMSKLCVLQNKAIKLICDGKKSDHVTSYYSKLNILKLQDLYKHEVAKIVFQFSRDNLPLTLQHLFSKTSEILFRNTRSSTNIYNLQQCTLISSTNIYNLQQSTRLQKSIKYKGVKIQNKISLNLKTNQTEISTAVIKN